MTETTKRPVKATKTAPAKTPATPSTPKATVAPKVAAPKVATSKSKPVKTAKVATAKVANVTPIAPAVKEVKSEKHKKPKMVRDSFTMPAMDYAHIAALKERCLKAGVSAKKSEVLRAALHCLAALPDGELTKAISGLEVIKTGRPSKG